MKKLSQRQKVRHIRHCQKRERKSKVRKSMLILHAPYSNYPNPNCRHISYVTIWAGNETEKAICTRRPELPPEILSLSENLTETAKCLGKIRSALLGADSNQKNSRFIDRRKCTPRIPGYFDFSRISEIDTAAAVVLAAEYRRASEQAQELPPCVNLDAWAKTVFYNLDRMGFFKTLKLDPRASNTVVEDSGLKTMQLVELEKNDSKILCKIEQSLKELGAYVQADERDIQDQASQIMTALTEAIANVTHHAYPEDHGFEIPHIKKLWVSASASRKNHELSVVVYDQGATIPITYNKMPWTKRCIQMFNDAAKREYEEGNPPDKSDDNIYIDIAAKYGKSQTEEKHRGKGLNQMRLLLQEIGNGNMSIISRNGWCKFDCKGTVDQGTIPVSIGGTLIQWKFRLATAK